MAVDLSHCNTPAKVSGHVGAAQLGEALEGAELVVIPAGVPRKPGMTRDDLFNINAGQRGGGGGEAAAACPQDRAAITPRPIRGWLGVSWDREQRGLSAVS